MYSYVDYNHFFIVKSAYIGGLSLNKMGHRKECPKSATIVFGFGLVCVVIVFGLMGGFFIGNIGHRANKLHVC